MVGIVSTHFRATEIMEIRKSSENKGAILRSYASMDRQNDVRSVDTHFAKKKAFRNCCHIKCEPTWFCTLEETNL
jgi:hypothetical protein